jgi:hypothetical protein
MLFAQYALQQLESLVQADAAPPTVLLLVAEWLDASIKVDHLPSCMHACLSLRLPKLL